MKELAHIPRGNSVIVNGTGSHRANTHDELVQLIGEEIVNTVRIVNHNAFDDAAPTHLGRTSYGGEIRVNNDYLLADVRIVTRFIEPHFLRVSAAVVKVSYPGLGASKLRSTRGVRLPPCGRDITSPHTRLAVALSPSTWHAPSTNSSTL